ncbi:hypothetical protein SESBI_03885 [Sesbania bispinosa]|nr:hypothetical protein SESBI_03885 [Sesbania bispinosa]
MAFQRSYTMTLMVLFCLLAVINNLVTARELKSTTSQQDGKEVKIGNENGGGGVHQAYPIPIPGIPNPIPPLPPVDIPGVTPSPPPK